MDLSAAEAAGNLTLDLPDAWFILDADRSTRRAAIEADTQAWIADNADRVAHRHELVETLWSFGGEADDKGALFAALQWQLGQYGRTVAHLMVFRGLRSAPHSVEAEVAAALEDLARPGPHDHGPRDVSEVRLPIGPAVRARFLGSSPADYSDGGPALVLDATQVWIPLTGQPPMVVISGTTPCLHIGDDIAAVVDAVAASVRLDGL